MPSNATTLLARVSLLALLLWTARAAPAHAQPVVAIPSVSAEADQAIDVPVNVRRFQDIGAVTLVVTYDANVLSFDSLTSAIRDDFMATARTPGEVRISWFDAAAPINIGEGTILTLAFSYAGGTTDLRLGAASEIADITATPLATTFRDGAVVPASQTRVSSDTSDVGADGLVDFGETGVDIQFEGVSGSGSVQVDKFSDAPTTRDGISEENVSSYRFVIEASGGLSIGSGTEVRLDASTLTGADDPSAVTIYTRSSPGKGAFTALTTTYDAGANELVATTDSFSEFALASNTNPLPVELAAFDAVLDGADVTLRWQTASETNNAGFEVQHRPEVASAWTTAGFVEGAGTSSAPQTYRFEVEDVAPGTHAFRLRQVDTDGTASLSDEVTVAVDAARALSLTTLGANPVREQMRLAFATPVAGAVQLALYNVLGQRVKLLHHGRAQAGRRYVVEGTADGLASGTYFVRLSAPGGTQTQQLVVVR